MTLLSCTAACPNPMLDMRQASWLSYSSMKLRWHPKSTVHCIYIYMILQTLAVNLAPSPSPCKNGFQLGLTAPKADPASIRPAAVLVANLGYVFFHVRMEERASYLMQAPSLLSSPLFVLGASAHKIHSSIRGVIQKEEIQGSVQK